MKYLPILIAVMFLMSCNNSSQEATENTANGITRTATKKDKNDIQWMTLEEVQKANIKNPRKVMVDVYTPWCGPCKMMMKSTFKDPELISFINKNYHAVKFNAEGPDPITVKGKEYANPQFNKTLPQNRRNAIHQFTATLGVRGYPTIIVFDPELNKLEEAVGFRSAQQMMEFLKGLKG